MPRQPDPVVLEAEVVEGVPAGLCGRCGRMVLVLRDKVSHSCRVNVWRSAKAYYGGDSSSNTTTGTSW